MKKLFPFLGVLMAASLAATAQTIDLEADSTAEDLPYVNVLGAIESRIPGFYYGPAENAAGDNTTLMTLRGMNVFPRTKSAGGNAPAIVVDGLVFTGSVGDIDICDVSSIEVLKDASASTLYGVRGGNGVIVINTKKGSGKRVNIRFSSSASVSDWSRQPEFVTDETTFLQNRFRSLQANRYRDASMKWSDYGSNAVAAEDLMNPTELEAYKRGITTWWLDEVSRTAVGQKYNLSVSGDTGRVSYYVSGNYTRQQGVMLGDDYQRANSLVKVEAKPASWLRIGIRGLYSDGRNWGQISRIQNAIWTGQYSLPNVDIPGYENWARLRPDGLTINARVGNQSGKSNLYTSSHSLNFSLNALGYASIDFPFLHGLSYELSYQIQRNSRESSKNTDPRLFVNTDSTREMDNPSMYGSYMTNSSENIDYDYNAIVNRLSFDRQFGRHGIKVLAGLHSEKYSENGNNLQNKSNTSYKALIDIKIPMSSISTGVQYSFDNMFFVSGNVLREHRKIGDERKNNTYYDVSAAIVPGKSIIRKLHASFGSAAKQPLDYFGHNRMTRLDAGADFSVAGGRFTGAIDLYSNKSSTVISNIVLSGNNALSNKGIELTLHSINTPGAFRWESDLAISINRNRITELYGESDGDIIDIASAVSYGYDAYYTLILGKSITSAYDYRKLGIFQNQDEIDNHKNSKGVVIQPSAWPGDIKFADINDDGRIIGGDKEWLGDGDPLFVLNFANTLRWEGLSLYFNLRWAQGNKEHFIAANPGAYNTNMSSGTQLAWVKPWSGEGSGNTYPRYGSGSSRNLDYNFWSSRSYLKLSDLVLSYTLPQKLTQKFGSDRTRIYLSGSNLLTFTGWKGWDPENGGTIAVSAASDRWVSYGTFRTIRAGVELSF